MNAPAAVLIRADADVAGVAASAVPRFGAAAMVDAATVRAFTPWSALIDRLAEAFAAGAEVPLRQHHDIAPADPRDATGTLLLMPAWRPGRAVGVKVLQVAPDNAAHGIATLQSTYLLSSARTGELLAVIDGSALTVRRTAAVSALAARQLARPDVRRLLVVGTGRLAPALAAAHAAVRDLAEIVVWGRRAARAHATAAEIAATTGLPARVATDLEAAARAADVITCATLSREPLVHGAWLRPGTHVDLVGAFKPHMREADDATLRDADVWVDTLDGVCAEGGDVVQAIASGALARDAIRGDLRSLCLRCPSTDPRGRVATRRTVFKSVGSALSDLAAAELIVATLDARPTLPGEPPR
jgi:ornithine cyclodeaminase